jgi:hypothetical protein
MHRARIRGPRLHPAHRLRPFFISSLLMSNILQRDLPLALISSTYHFGSPRIETLSAEVPPPRARRRVHLCARARAPPPAPPRDLSKPTGILNCSFVPRYPSGVLDYPTGRIRKVGNLLPACDFYELKSHGFFIFVK